MGHTHEDVDQFFSKVSSYIKRVGAETVSGEKVIMVIAIIIVDTLVSTIGLTPKQNGHHHISPLILHLG